MMAVLENILLLLRASRPVASWPAGMLLFLIGYYVSGAAFSPLMLLHVPIFLLLPLVVFGLNDAYDYETDRLSGRKNSLIEGYVLSRGKRLFILRACYLSAIILVLFSFATGNPTRIAAITAGVLLAFAYSVPPIRLKSIPIADSLSNALATAIVLLLGFSFGGTLTEFPPKLAVASLIMAGIHAVGAAMDYLADKKAGIQTIATKYGKRFAAVFSMLLTSIILAFSGISSMPLNVFFWLWLLVSLAAFIKPQERFIRRLIIFAYAPALLAMMLFLYQQFYK
jgi:4-hydroxybenzoate polyprenyltransferase